MLRQSITRPAIAANRALCQRSFSAIAPRMGEGDTGAPRSGGGGSSGYVANPPPKYPIPLISPLWCGCRGVFCAVERMACPPCRCYMTSSIANIRCFTVMRSPSARLPRKPCTSVRRNLRSKSLGQKLPRDSSTKDMELMTIGWIDFTV